MEDVIVGAVLAVVVAVSILLGGSSKRVWGENPPKFWGKK